MKKKQIQKNRKAEVTIPFPMKFSVILIFAVVFGISYIWLCSRCEQLGNDIKQRESELRASQTRLTNEKERWASMQTPANVDRALKRHGLQMTLPDARQIVHVRSGGAPVALAYNN